MKETDIILLEHSYSKVLPTEAIAAERMDEDGDRYSTLLLDLSRAHTGVSYGLRISDKSGVFLVTQVAPGSPADTAGFMPQVSTSPDDFSLFSN